MDGSRAAVGVIVLLVGLAAGAGGGWLVWGRRAAALQQQAAQVQGERERLHHELSDIVRERKEMADTAEHLRAQVEQQLRRLEALATELAPPPEAQGEPGAEPAP